MHGSHIGCIMDMSQMRDQLSLSLAIVGCCNVLFTVMDRYGSTNTGTLVVQRCIGTEAKLYDCWYYSVDSEVCVSDLALECNSEYWYCQILMDT